MRLTVPIEIFDNFIFFNLRNFFQFNFIIKNLIFAISGSLIELIR